MTGDPGDVDLAILDDIEINQALINPFHLPMNITRVTFGIVQFPGATPVSITGYYSTTSPDADNDGFPEVDSPIHSFGTADIPEFNGNDPAVYNAVIGDGLSTLFTITPNFTNLPGYGQFALGLSFSDTDTQNIWGVVDPNAKTDNSLVQAWFYDFGSAEGFSYQLTDEFDQPIDTTFLVTIEGSLVPEPATLALAAPGALILLRRRRAA
jgi:hypothetical protein